MSATEPADATAAGPTGGGPPGPADLEALAAWVAVPSVSSDPGRAGDVRRSARLLAEEMRRAGAPRAEVWETPGLPAVFGHWPAADPRAPRLLVYSHHDVHAADPAEWRTTRPFTPLL
ncbi:hypothetical protein AB0J65_32685, partial [Streptomyces toxytricini]